MDDTSTNHNKISTDFAVSLLIAMLCNPNPPLQSKGKIGYPKLLLSMVLKLRSAVSKACYILIETFKWCHYFQDINVCFPVFVLIIYNYFSGGSQGCYQNKRKYQILDLFTRYLRLDN